MEGEEEVEEGGGGGRKKRMSRRWGSLGGRGEVEVEEEEEEEIKFVLNTNLRVDHYMRGVGVEGGGRGGRRRMIWNEEEMEKGTD